MTSDERSAGERAAAAFGETLQAHDGCTWKQAGPCVYCTDHGIRLYQGELPERKRTVPRGARGEQDWDPEMGLGFYSQCRTCGFTEWNP